MEISLCMIVRDEADVITRCLESAKPFVDEIIIVDTGSVDDTKYLAEQAGAKVYDFTWVDDFALARNYAFALATKEYLFWLDADDIIPEESLEPLLNLKATLPPEIACVYLPYATSFDASGNAGLVFDRERLFRRDAAPLWVGAIHETCSYQGQNLHATFRIEHHKLHPSDPDRNLRIYEKLLREGRKLSTRDEFYYARELMYHDRLDEAIEGYKRFLSEADGWIENRIDASQELSRCFKRVGDRTSCLNALIDCLAFAPPRAEVLCAIGQWWMEEENYYIAKGWYLAAAAQQPDVESGGFVNLSSYDYIPYMQLVVCYDRLGDAETAEKFNELAGEISPQDASYLHNKEYFANKKAPQA